jgi:hypothetical protein
MLVEPFPAMVDATPPTLFVPRDTCVWLRVPAMTPPDIAPVNVVVSVDVTVPPPFGVGDVPDDSNVYVYAPGPPVTLPIALSDEAPIAWQNCDCVNAISFHVPSVSSVPLASPPRRVIFSVPAIARVDVHVVVKSELVVVVTII